MKEIYESPTIPESKIYPADSETKTTGLFIRMSPEQKAVIERLAVKMGFKTSAWVRQAAMNTSLDLTRIEHGLNEIEKRGLK